MKETPLNTNSKLIPLSFTNTLTRKKEIFVPIIPGKISIYCCGVTVYDLCHLGHARSYIVWDVLRRYLLWLGYEVRFVQNFTDIDDKILNKAFKEGSTMQEVSSKNIAAFHKDMDALGILRPDSMPRATKCLDSIRDLISELQDKGVAYESHGDVYFSISSCSEYGKLSGRDLTTQQKNADGRIEKHEEERKRNVLDFALWKSAKPGEASFPSSWGPGRPGWHIECSAMVREELGETIDIHLGGSDLVFPHHENEIAQSEAANDKELAHFWLHNGMVNVKGQKMSKSIGNFKTIRSLLESGVSPMTLRMFVLQAHYRKPLDFTDESLLATSTGWKGLNSALNFGNIYSKLLEWNKMNFVQDELEDKLKNSKSRFVNSMNDDLNTSGALSVLFELSKPLRSLAKKLELNEQLDLNKLENFSLFSRWNLLVELASSIGLYNEDDATSTPLMANSLKEEQIEKAILERKVAKNNKDFQKADKIRDFLKTHDIELLDKKDGITHWRYEPRS